MSEKNKNNRNNLWDYKFKPLDVLTENDETLSSPPPEFTENDFFQSEEWMNESGIDFILDHEPLLCNLEEEVQFYIEDIKEHMKYLDSINISLKSQLKYQTQFSDKIERKYEETVSLNNSLGEFMDQLKDEVELNKQRCERFQIENVILRKEIRILKEALNKVTGGANPIDDSRSFLGNKPTCSYRRLTFEERTHSAKTIDKLSLQQTPLFGKLDSTPSHNGFHKDSMIMSDHHSQNCFFAEIVAEVEGGATDIKIARTNSCTNLAASENEDEGNDEDGDVEKEKKNSSIDLAADDDNVAGVDADTDDVGADDAGIDLDSGEDGDVELENSAMDLVSSDDDNAAGVDADINAVVTDDVNIDVDTGVAAVDDINAAAVEKEKKNSSIDLAADDDNAAGVDADTDAVGADDAGIDLDTGEYGDVKLENSAMDFFSSDDDNAAGVDADINAVGADDVNIDVDDINAAAVDDKAGDVDADTDPVGAGDIDVVSGAAAVDNNAATVDDNAGDVDADTDAVGAGDVDIDVDPGTAVVDNNADDNVFDVEADTDVAAADDDGDVDVDDADADGVKAVPPDDSIPITETLGDIVVHSADTKGYLVNAYNKTDNTNEEKDANEIEEKTEGKNTDKEGVDNTPERKQFCTDISATSKDFGEVDEVVNESSSGKLDLDLNELEVSDDDDDSVEDIKLERKKSLMDLTAVAAAAEDGCQSKILKPHISESMSDHNLDEIQTSQAAITTEQEHKADEIQTSQGAITTEQEHKADISSGMSQTVTGAEHFNSAPQMYVIAGSVHTTVITPDVSNITDKDDNNLRFGVATATDTSGVEKHEPFSSKLPEEIESNKSIITGDTQKHKTHHKKSVLNARKLLRNDVIVIPSCGLREVSESSTEVMEDHSPMLLARSSSLFLRPVKSRETSPEKLPSEKEAMTPLLKPHPSTERLTSSITSSEFKLLSKASLGKMMPLKLSSVVHMPVHPPLSSSRSPAKTQKKPLKLAKSTGLLPSDLPNCIPIAAKVSREFRPTAVKRGRGIRLHIPDEEAYAKIKRCERVNAFPKVSSRTLGSNSGPSAPDDGVNEGSSGVTVAKAKNGECVIEIPEVISRKKSTSWKSELIRQRSSFGLPINRLGRIPLPDIPSSSGGGNNSETKQMQLPKLNIPVKFKTLKSPTPPIEEQFVKGPMKMFGNLAAASRTTELKGRSRSVPCIVDLNLPFRTLIKRF